MELLVGAFTGIELMSRALARRAVLGHQVSGARWRLLPAPTVPGTPPCPDIAPGRGAERAAATSQAVPA
ncbi:hypothetical protein [Streptomyces hebeiensis]